VKSLLTFDGRYAAIFIGRGPLEPLMQVEVPLGLDLATYRSPNVALSVLIGAEHLEPALRWLRDAHNTCAGASFLAEIFNTKSSIPTASHCHLIRAPFAELDDSLAEKLVSHNVLCARLPFSDELLILCSAETGTRLCVAHTGLRSQADFGLQLVASRSTPVPVGQEPTGTYDPVGAQANETLRRTSVTFDDNLSDVRRLLREQLGIDPPAELHDVDQEVRRHLSNARRLFAKLDAGGGDEDLAATTLDIAARLGTDYTERLAGIADQLRVHVEVPNPWTNAVTYARVAEPLALRAVRAVVGDIADALVSANPPRALVPVLGKQFAAQAGVLGELEWRGDAPGVMGMLVSFPRRLVLRAGALPVLANPVTVATCDIETPARELSLGDLTKAGEALGVRLDGGPASTAEDAAGALSRAEVLLCDLVAVCVAGPAYVFSLARFQTGSMSGGAATLPAERAPALDERIRACLRLLRRLRVQIPFASRYVADDRMPCNKQLADTVLGLVRERYDGRQSRLRPVIKALRKGEIVDEPPSLLLNALWDAVVRRSGYLNEVALYESLIRAAL
jgi:hypothetical protein